ncbi:hypothetical protein JCM15519_24570 [Fundidesulfovibrio butyratiphilus]
MPKAGKNAPVVRSLGEKNAAQSGFGPLRDRPTGRQKRQPIGNLSVDKRAGSKEWKGVAGRSLVGPYVWLGGAVLSRADNTRSMTASRVVMSTGLDT